MVKMVSCLSAAVLLSACAGCLSSGTDVVPPTVMADGTVLNRIPGVESIVIPAGISDKMALDVVEQVVTLNNSGETRNRWRGEWRMEDRDAANKWIRVGYSVREHYLCVCYRIENGKLVPDVPTSTNLRQNGCSIHRKVPAWINAIRPMISERLYKCTKAAAAAK